MLRGRFDPNTPALLEDQLVVVHVLADTHSGLTLIRLPGGQRGAVKRDRLTNISLDPLTFPRGSPAIITEGKFKGYVVAVAAELAADRVVIELPDGKRSFATPGLIGLTPISPKSRGPCTEPSQTRLVRAHGRMSLTNFPLQEGTSVVTLSQVGQPCPLSPALDGELEAFYSRGNAVFTGTGQNKTEEGIALEGKFRKGRKGVGGDVHLRFHKGDGERMLNDMILQFIGPACPDNCNITCCEKDKEPFTERPKYASVDVVAIRLSQLIEIEGPGKYVIVACRNANEEHLQLLRQISERWG